MIVKELKEELDEWDETLPVYVIDADATVKEAKKVQAYEPDKDYPGRLVIF